MPIWSLSEKSKGVSRKSIKMFAVCLAGVDEAKLSPHRLRHVFITHIRDADLLSEEEEVAVANWMGNSPRSWSVSYEVDRQKRLITSSMGNFPPLPEPQQVTTNQMVVLPEPPEPPTATIGGTTILSQS